MSYETSHSRPSRPTSSGAAEIGRVNESEAGATTNLPKAGRPTSGRPKGPWIHARDRETGSGERGFTLFEIIIAIALMSFFAIPIMYNAIITPQRTYLLQEELASMQQNLRASLELTTREIRRAGFGRPAWSVNGYAQAVSITEGDTSPDSIDLVGCFNTPPANLGADADEGDTEVTLQSTAEASYFTVIDSETDSSRSNIFINGLENVVITGITDAVLTIDTDPVTGGNQGLAFSHQSGSTVGLVQAISYSIADEDLMRNDHDGPTPTDQLVAENITDLQLTIDGSVITVLITGRTDKGLNFYGDGYSQETLETRVTARNLGL